MDANSGKAPSFSMRYNAANEELEEIYTPSDEDPPIPQFDAASYLVEGSPKRDKTSSIIEKYFKSAKADKTEDAKNVDQTMKSSDQVNASPVKDYLNRFSGKKTGTPDANAVGEPVKDSTNETWKIFHDFKYKIAQAVEDMKSGRANDSDVKDKPIARDGSVSDSEDNSAVCECDKQSICDTDNQVSSLESSIQNLSELTAPCSTRKTSESEASCPADSHSSNSTESHTPKNHLCTTKSLKAVDDTHMEVESGVEAFEESGFYPASDELKPESPQLIPTSAAQVTVNTPKAVNRITLQMKPKETAPIIFSYTILILSAIVLMNLWLLPDYYMWNGFLLGLWFFHLATVVKDWGVHKLKSLLLDDNQQYIPVDSDDTIPIINIPAIEEHQPLRKFEGWVNQYRATDYDPITYHINKTTSVFMKLEGTSLRISYTRSKIPKRASWDEQIEKATFFQHRLYNLSGAKINLLPEGIVGKRHWSKKYPLCITLSGKEKVQILEREPAPLKGNEKIPGIPSEPATPEKTKPIQSEPESFESLMTVEDTKSKKKFVWKRGGQKKSSNSTQFTETDDLISKEGLRHRLIRKLHKVPDKKKDSEPAEPPSTSVIDEVINTIYLEEEQDEQSCRIHNHHLSIEESLEDEELVRNLKDMLDFEDWESNPSDSAHTLERWTYKESGSSKNVLFVFARTGRDKLEWHRRLINAIASAKESLPAVDVDGDKGETKPTLSCVDDCTVFRVAESEASVTLPSRKWNTAGSVPESPTRTPPPTLEASPPPEPNVEPQLNLTKHEREFWPYIYKFMQGQAESPSKKRMTSLSRLMSSHEEKKKRASSTETIGEPESPLWTDASWLNALVARAAYDALRNPLWAERARLRIQRKLHTLKLPVFMSPLMVQHIELGSTCPRLAALRGPRADERGLWWYGELRYSGGATLTLTTQLNLMKLKEKGLEQTELDVNESEPSSPKDTGDSVRLLKPAIYDSDVDDTPESSSDEEGLPVLSDEEEEEPSASSELPSASSKKKFLKMVDKITTNKYFQQISDYKYVKRAMEGLSNTDIKLTVEMRGLHGELALNMPPPPHDRLWLGFRGNPNLTLKARPAVGTRSVRFAHITNWIEQKLCKEFQRVLVLPNMEDFLVDVMTPTPVSFE